MRNVGIIFRRQIADTLRNPAVLIQFVMFPLLAILMSALVQIEGMPEDFFITLFAAMYAGMAPLVAMSALVAEEKEESTLRVLIMSGVRPWEYLLGVGLFVWGGCMIGSAALCLAGEWTGSGRAVFLLVMGAGIATSTFLGAAIGTGSPSQMAATSICVPVMLVLSFLPMLAVFNEGAESVSRLLYTGQVSLMLGSLGTGAPDATGMIVIAVNMAAAITLFALSYRRAELA